MYVLAWMKGARDGVEKQDQRDGMDELELAVEFHAMAVLFLVTRRPTVRLTLTHSGRGGIIGVTEVT